MDKDRQEAKERVKGYTFKEKLNYYWGYYKYPFLVVMVLVLLLGYTIYGKLTAVKPDSETMVFSGEYITEKTTENMEKHFSGWLKEEKNDDNEYFANVSVTFMPDEAVYNMDAVTSANTKLTAVLAAEQATALIFDGETYARTMINGEFGYLENKEYSGEIGENAKKLLGLNPDLKYYYITTQTKQVDEGREEAVKMQKNAIIVYEKLKELN